MTFLKTQRIFGFAILSSLTLLAYTNCAGPLSSPAQTEDQSSFSQPDQQLQLTVERSALNYEESVVFEANGGVPPYSYFIVTGGGTLNANTGHYRAPNYDVTTIAQVRDSAGEIAQATVYISFKSDSAITLTTNPAKINVGTATTLSAAGGTAPYSYQIISGVGVINGNSFQSAVAGSATIGIVDAKGLQNSVTVQVTAVSVLETVQIYRWFNPTVKRSYFTTTQKASTGWTAQGAAFKVLKSQEPQTVLLVRCKFTNPERFFLSSSGNCSNQVSDAPLGYIYTQKLANTLELYNCFNSRTNDYLATTVLTACTSNGYARRTNSFGYVPK